MTDPTPRPDDEIVSAVLDGEAQADERARVEDDPTSQERLAQFEQTRRLLAAPVPVPADARERAIAAALAEFDQLRGASSSPSIAATVTPASATTGPATDGATTGITAAGPPPPSDELAARRSSSGAGRRSSRSSRLLAVAAAVVLVLLGAGAVVRVLNPPSELTVASSGSAAPDRAAEQSTANSPTPESDGGQVSDASATTAPNAPVPTTVAPATSTTVAPAVAYGLNLAGVTHVDLGAVSTPAQLRFAMAGVLAGQSEQAAATPPAIASQSVIDCANDVLAIDPEVSTILATGIAVYEGRPAVVLAFAVDQVAHPAANGPVRIYAVDAGDCSTLSVQTI